MLALLAVVSSLAIVFGYRSADSRLLSSMETELPHPAELDSIRSSATHSIVTRDGRTITLPEDVHIAYEEPHLGSIVCGKPFHRPLPFGCERGVEGVLLYMPVFCPSEFWFPNFIGNCYSWRTARPYPQYLLVSGEWSVRIDADGYVMDSKYHDSSPEAFPFLEERPIFRVESIAQQSYRVAGVATLVLAASLLLVD